MTSTGSISLGTSAASFSDGSEGGERPGNTWLFTPTAAQKTRNHLTAIDTELAR